jgi:hypothetical protein
MVVKEMEAVVRHACERHEFLWLFFSIFRWGPLHVSLDHGRCAKEASSICVVMMREEDPDDEV